MEINATDLILAILPSLIGVAVFFYLEYRSKIKVTIGKLSVKIKSELKIMYTTKFNVTKKIVIDLAPGLNQKGTQGFMLDTFTVQSDSPSVVTFAPDPDNKLRFIGTQVGPGTANVLFTSVQRPSFSVDVPITVHDPVEEAVTVIANVTEQ
jgi:hypothetical protein